MGNYKEQKSGIKIVSIRRVYEWISNFLLDIEESFGGDDQIFGFPKKKITKAYVECRRKYLEYVSLAGKNSLKIVANKNKLKKLRQELCNMLIGVISNDGVINEFSDVINNKINDIRKNELNIKQLSDEQKKANIILHFINTYNFHSRAILQKDLQKIQKEKSVKSVISAVITNKNKNKASNNKYKILDYATDVTTFVKTYFNSYRTILKKHSLNAEHSKYMKAIASMLRLWDNEYSATQIQSAKVDKLYCRKLFGDLKSITRKNHIEGETFEMTVMFVQLVTKLVGNLNEYIKQKASSDKFFDKWFKDFNNLFEKVEDKEKFFNEENIKDLIAASKKTLIDFNNKMVRYEECIKEFHKIYGKVK